MVANDVLSFISQNHTEQQWAVVVIDAKPGHKDIDSITFLGAAENTKENGRLIYFTYSSKASSAQLSSQMKEDIYGIASDSHAFPSKVHHFVASTHCLESLFLVNSALNMRVASNIPHSALIEGFLETLFLVPGEKPCLEW